MNLSGSIFKNAMTTNQFVVSDHVLTIHNTEMDYGIINNYEAPDGVDCKFTISKKDYQTLAMLPSFDLQLKDDKILIKSKNGKITLANMVDVPVPNTDMEGDVQQLDVVAKDFLAGEKFVGSDSTRYYLNGANITPSGYFVSDSKHLFIKYHNTGISKPVCVPKETFKYIGKSDVCMTNGRLAAFVDSNTNEVFYTVLITPAIDIPKFDYTPKVVIEVDKYEILGALKMMHGYAKNVRFVKQDKLHLISNSDTNQFDIAATCEFKLGSKLNVTCNVDDLLKVIELSDDIKTTISFASNLVFYEKGDTKAVTAYVNQAEPMEVE